MTDDEIIARAKSLGWNVEDAQTNRMLILFARDVEDQVRYQEREACAKMCEAYMAEGLGREMAVAIRGNRALLDSALLSSDPGGLKERGKNNGS